MATAWGVAFVGWTIIMLGWFLSPIITLALPTVISYLWFDEPQKIKQLEINVMPDLQKALRAVDQERMIQMGETERVESDVAELHAMAAILRHAREELEDIFDAHQDIELYRNRCFQHLYRAVKAWVYCAVEACLRFLQKQLHMLADKAGTRLDGAVATCESSFIWLQQWAQARRSQDVLPVTTSTAAPSDEATTGAAASDELPVPATAPSESSGCWLTHFVDFIEKWVCIAAGFSCFLRNWPYDELFGITGYQGKASLLDFVPNVITRLKLKIRIDNVEVNVGNVKKSSLMDFESKNTPKDRANKDKSKIKTDIKLKVFGRKELRDNIMEKLRDIPSSSTSLCYSAIGIYGLTGCGKTTFARYTHDYIKDDCKEEKLFHAIMCIHLSKTFIVDDIFREMLRDITKDKKSNITNHNVLKDKLEESLRGKRFFLILDDLCVKNKNDKQLQELMSPLNVGMRGSKILVTAQTKDARALCDDEPIEMPYLDGDQYFSMFMHYARLDSSVANDQEFISVGREIAEKLHRSPIAAVMIAGRLGADPDILFWKNIAALDMFSDTMGALWWSYHELNPDIRRCFKYCKIFPRRFKLEKEDLVRLWIAQGFVKTSSAKHDMEDVAESYIHELALRLFLQPEGRFFTIHDMVHDLIDKVAGSDYFIIENAMSQRVEDQKMDVPGDVRHLFIQSYDTELITDKIIRLEHLRSLIFNGVEMDTRIAEKFIERMCKRVPKLRVLAFVSIRQNQEIEQANKLLIPKAIDQLKHLRYLCFRACYRCTVILPCTLSKLYRIQLLHFGCANILKFTFVDLVNLRHIVCATTEFPNMGRRISLQTIPSFIIRNEQGYEKKQLRDLNKLRGILHIIGLEKVHSKKQALEANLSAKKRLTTLTLSWTSRDCSRDVQTEVLEGLCPPVRLERLEIEYYNGLKYPDWMMGTKNGGLKNLQQLRLWECERPSELALAFPQLRVLELWFCSWDALPGNMNSLTSLKELVIVRCLNIQSLQTLPPSLEEFRLEDCDNKFMKSCQNKKHPYWEMIRYIPLKVFEPPISEEDSDDEESDSS
ncbi:unnamed protein product [Alopecurus aequalis]